jgi:hypothetical protein
MGVPDRTRGDGVGGGREVVLLETSTFTTQDRGMSTVPPTISRRSSVLVETEQQGLVQLKMQLRKESQNSWREFVEQTTASVEREHNTGLLVALEVSKEKSWKPGRLRELPHLPPLMRGKHSPSTGDNREKAQVPPPCQECSPALWACNFQRQSSRASPHFSALQ